MAMAASGCRPFTARGARVGRCSRVQVHCCTGDREHVLCSRRAALLASAIGTLGLAAAPTHAFGPVSVKLNDLEVTQVPCEAGISTVTGVTFSGATSKAACLTVSAKATNPSDKPLFNADVFGRVYDAQGEAALDDTENIRVAYIGKIEPGASVVSFKLTVPAEQYKLGPLKLTSFKATGFPGKNLPNQGSGLIQDDELCDIEGLCEDADEAAIR